MTGVVGISEEGEVLGGALYEGRSDHRMVGLSGCGIHGFTNASENQINTFCEIHQQKPGAHSCLEMECRADLAVITTSNKYQLQFVEPLLCAKNAHVCSFI